MPRRRRLNRRLNRKARFPLRPWQLRYVSELEPKLKKFALALVAEIDKRGIPQRFLDYLNEKSAARREPKDDSAAMDKLCKGVLDSVGSPDIDKAIDKLTGAVYSAGSKHAFDKIGIDASWNLKSPAFEDALNERKSKLKGVGEVQFTRVKNIIREQVYNNGGSSIEPGYLERVRKAAGASSKSHAESIARTESAAVSSAAARQVYSANGIPEKEWLWSHSGYDRHEDLDGEIVGMDEAFSNGAQHPGDGDADEAINCMCAMAPVIPDDYTIDPDTVVTE